MAAVRFTWDPGKAKSNRIKHRVTFEEAQTVFEDTHALLIHDPDHSDDEDRFILMGVSERLRILVVCHCYCCQDAEIRLISARRATTNEQHLYEEQQS